MPALAAKGGAEAAEPSASSLGSSKWSASSRSVREDGKIVDMIGIVTTLEGPPLPKGAIANRLGDFDDVAALEQRPDVTDAELVETLLSVKNDVHNNYQDFQASWTTAGASACSTIRCSTAPTTSIRSWWRWRWSRCWSSSRARWR